MPGSCQGKCGEIARENAKKSPGKMPGSSRRKYQERRQKMPGKDSEKMPGSCQGKRHEVVRGNIEKMVIAPVDKRKRIGRETAPLIRIFLFLGAKKGCEAWGA